MTRGISRAWARSFQARCLQTPSLTRRSLSTKSLSEQTAFSYSIPTPFTSWTKAQQQDILTDIRTRTSSLRNTTHDAAVLLVSPSLAGSLDSSSFMSHLVGILAGEHLTHPSAPQSFHLVSAVVDAIAPTLGSDEPIRGLSILRGRLDDMLPQLWDPAPSSGAQAARDATDAVAALTFRLGAASVSLPLAKTPFLNSRPSTLLTSRYDLSGASTPRLVRSAEKRSQQIAWSSRRSPRGVADLGLFAPLVPLTEAREVTESFGNIVRRIKVRSESVPASGELEAAVNALHEKGALSEYASGPVNVWAVVTPAQESASSAAWLQSAPRKLFAGRDGPDVKELVSTTTAYLSQLYSHGGRIYRILSGGGGWGAKQGLLSLDPQHTHFPPSEEEEMARFMKTMEDSGFTPRGSRIQFFISPPTLPGLRPLLLSPTSSANITSSTTARSTGGSGTITPGISLGVAGEQPPRANNDPEQHAAAAEQAQQGTFVEGHFGALSSEALFISGPGLPEGETTKLSVHHSRVFAASSAQGEDMSNDDLGRQFLEKP